MLTYKYNLAYIVDQVDERTFQARFCGIYLIVTCYLSHELYYQNIRLSEYPTFDGGSSKIGIQL